MKKAEGGFGLIGMLLVLAIAAAITIMAMRNYYKKPAIDKETQKVMAEQGIDTTSHHSILDSVKKTLQNAKDSRQEEQAE